MPNQLGQAQTTPKGKASQGHGNHVTKHEVWGKGASVKYLLPLAMGGGCRGLPRESTHGQDHRRVPLFAGVHVIISLQQTHPQQISPTT